ncbi:MAG: hypothetical protein U0X75_18300 [Acidobacteriota bacterium]
MKNFARLVTQEHGKTHEEAKGDIRRGIEMVNWPATRRDVADGANAGSGCARH